MNPILYILMRNDLPSMNPGKAMAQASHASNAFIDKFDSKKIRAWKQETGQGFGTVTVLGVNNTELTEAIHAAEVEGHPCEFITDPTYPYIVSEEISKLIPKRTDTAEPFARNDGQIVRFRNEITCGYIFGEKEELKPIIGHLKLHP